MFTIAVAVHVLLAVFTVGPMTVLPMTGLRHLRTGNGSAAADLVKPTIILSGASLVMVLAGFAALGMKDDVAYARDWSLRSTWIWLSLVLYVIGLALTILVVVPALRVAPEAGPGKSPAYGKVAAASGVATLLLLIVVVLMVAKP